MPEKRVWLLLLLSLLVSRTASAQVAQNITYVYDAAGQVMQVAPSTGSNNQLVYDPVGNVLAVSNGAAGTLTITQFSPTYGPGGTTVTINGTGFDPSASNDSVTFNGVAATVTAASPTALSVLVPASATSGPISIVNANGNASSTASFAIGPVLVAGNDPTVANIAANQASAFNFNGVAGQGVTLSLTGVVMSSTATNFRVTVSQPNGSALLSTPCVISSDSNCVLPYLPVTGTYTISVANGTSATTINLALVPDATANLSSRTPLTFSPAFNQAASYTFAGTAGQAAQFILSGDSINGATSVQLYAPNGTFLQSGVVTSNAGSTLMTVTSLPATGTYTLRLLPAAGNAAGSVQVALASASSSSLSVGTASPSSLAAGQMGQFTFTGSAGQYLGMAINSLTTTPAGGSLNVTVYDPSGNTIDSFNVTGSTYATGLLPLTSGGTYTILTNPGTGSAAFNMLLLADQVGTLSVGGGTASFTSSQIGQSGDYSFSGTAGQNLNLALSNDTFAGVSLIVYQPNGTVMAQTSMGATGGQASLPLNNLPASGTYIVRAVPQNTATGSLTLELQSNAVGAIAIDAGATQEILATGQIGTYTFSATAGQSLGVGLGGAAFTPVGSSANVSVNDPGGNQIAQFSISGSGGGVVLPILTKTGTYSITVNPAAGAVSFNLVVSSDIAANLAVGGAAASFTASQPGQAETYTFSGVTGQDLGLLVNNDAIPGNTVVNVYQPNGSLLANTTVNNTNNSESSSSSLLLNALPVTGNYSIRLVPQNGALGNASLTLQQETFGTVSASTSMSGSLAAAQQGSYTFAGVAGQGYGLSITGLMTTPANGSVTVAVNDPNGNSIAQFTAFGTNTGYILPILSRTGTYSVVVNPGTSAATFNLQLNPDVMGFLTVGGSQQTFTATMIGQAASYAFSGSRGQSLGLVLSNSTFPAGTTMNVMLGNATEYSAGFTGTSTALEMTSLPASGSYVVRLTPAGASGSVSLALVSPVTGTLNVNGGATAESVTAGQEANFTFVGTVGQSLSLAMSPVTITPGNGTIAVSVIDPNGNVVNNSIVSGAGLGVVLPTVTTSGNYTIVVNPGPNVANFSLSVNSNATGSLTVGGPAATFTSTTIGQGAAYTFNGTAGQDVGLLVSTTFANATVFVTQPNGNVLYPRQVNNSLVLPSSISVGGSMGAPGYNSLEMINLPVTGTYTITVIPRGVATGSVTLSLSDEVISPLTVNGGATPVTLALGQIAKLTFIGNTGQNIGLGFESILNAPFPVPTLPIFKGVAVDPLGTIINSFSSSDGGSWQGVAAGGASFGYALPTVSNNGTYEVFVYLPAQGAQESSLTFNVTASSSVTGGVIPPASNAVNAYGQLTNLASLTTSIPGQGAIFSFNGVAGQTVSLLADIPEPFCGQDVIGCVGSGPIGATLFSVYSPSGAFLASMGTDVIVQVPGGGNSIGALSVSGGLNSALLNLPQTGTYQVFAEPVSGNVGVINMALMPVVTGTINVNGAVLNSSTLQGQTGMYTFTGSAGQNLVLDITIQGVNGGFPIPVNPNATVTLTVTDPNGNVVRTFTEPEYFVVAGGLFPVLNYTLGLPLLTTSGTYTVQVNPGLLSTNFTLSVGQTYVNGGAIPSSGTMSVNVDGGQQQGYTFSGTAGQTLDLAMSGTIAASGTATMTILNPDGSTLTTFVFDGVGTVSNQVATLTQTGTYTMVLKGSAPAAINVAKSTDVTATLAVNGPATPLTIGTAGQAATYTFNGTAGEVLGLQVNAGNFSSYTEINVYGSNGALLNSNWYIGTGIGQFSLPSLPSTGNYTVRVLPMSGGTGSISLAMTAQASGAAPANNGIALNLAPTQQVSYSFTGSIGQTIDLGLVNIAGTATGSPVAMTILNPDGSTFSNVGAQIGTTGSVQSPAMTQAGTYTLLVTGGAYATSVNMYLSTDVFAPLVLNGATVPLTIAAPGQATTYTFSGTAGQSGSLVASAGSLSSSANINVYQPNGNLLSNNAYSGTGNSGINFSSLPVTGTYTVRVIPQNGAIGSVSMALNSLEAAPVNGTLAVNIPAGVAQEFIFTGTVGELLGLEINGVSTTPSGGSASVSIYDPKGNNLAFAPNGYSSPGVGASQTWIGYLSALSIAGTYTIKVSGGVDAVQASIMLNNDVTAPLTLDGGSVPVTISAAGQGATYTFNGTAGQVISLLSGGNLASNVYVQLFQPNGGQFWYMSNSGSGNYSSGPITLPATGAYQVRVIPVSAVTGSVTMALDSETTGVAPPSGPLTVSLEAGQTGIYTFTGTVGELLGLDISGVSTTPTGGSATVSIYDPNGNNLPFGPSGYQSPSVSASQTWIGYLSALSVTGTYKVKVSAGVDAVQVSIVLNNDVTAPLTLDGGSVPVTISAAGQGATYTFNGTAGQVISLLSGGNLAGNVYVQLFQPNGGQFWYMSNSGSGNYSSGPVTLPATGAYQVRVIPVSAVTGSVTMALDSETTGVAPTSGPLTVSLEAGQTGIYTFTGTVGELLGLDISGVSTTPSGGSASVSIYDPKGNNLAFAPNGYSSPGVGASQTWIGYLSALSIAGTYTIKVSGGVDAVQASIVLNNDVTAPLTLDGGSVPVTISAAGQGATYTFNGTAGQVISLLSGGNLASNVYVQLFQPNGGQFWYMSNSGSGNYSSGPITLPATGAYQVRVIPVSAATGTVSMSLSD